MRVLGHGRTGCRVEVEAAGEIEERASWLSPAKKPVVIFADAHLGVEAARWCFYTRTEPKGGELPLLLEDNDYEALAGHYVDDGEWLDSNAPLTFGFDSFEAWFTRLCAVVRREDLDLNDYVAVGNAMFE